MRWRPNSILGNPNLIFLGKASVMDKLFLLQYQLTAAADGTDHLSRSDSLLCGPSFSPRARPCYVSNYLRYWNHIFAKQRDE